MTTSTLNAWMLSKRGSGDTSLVVTFFTRELGIINCLYKGGRSANKQSILQPFTPLWLSIDERRGWYYIRQIESTAPVLEFTGTALFSGLYLNELVYHALKPVDAHETLFDAYQFSLNRMAHHQGKLLLEGHLRRFEWVLLNSCGYAMSFQHQARSYCPISPDNHYQFIAGEGFIQNAQGIPGSHLLAMAQDRLDHPDVLKTAKQIMRKAIDHLLDGRELKSRALFSTIAQ